MVLEDATTPSSPSSDSFLDSTPASDRDPYADGSSSEIRINLREIPRPVFGRLMGYNDAHMAKIISARIQVAAQAVGRPLTQEEALAMAQHTGRLSRVASYGVPVGLAAGFYRAYTAPSHRFPFFNLDQAKFDSSKFLALEGRAAQAAWQLARGSSYGALGVLFGSLFFTNYAAVVTAIRETYDPRLRNFNLALVERAKQHRAAHPSSGATPRSPTTRPRAEYGDDASPASTTAFDGGEQLAGNADEVSGGQVYSLDDASPTAAQQQTGDMNASADGGSAWDRIRKQGGSPSPIPSSPTRRTSNAEGSATRNVWAERRQAALQPDGQEQDLSSDMFGLSESGEK